MNGNEEENEQENNPTYFLIETTSNGNDLFKPKQVFLLQSSDVSSRKWTTTGVEGKEDLMDILYDSLECNFESWMDCLGKESAEAQNLKQPITSSQILKNGALKPTSPNKFTDDVFVVLSVRRRSQTSNHMKTRTRNESSPLSEVEPLAFLRMGKRPLFLSTEEQLVLVDDSLAALDIYSRVQRNGWGFLLLSHALNKYGVSMNKVAFDRPTEAMLTFLKKHFPFLGQATFHHNRFVTFPGFFH